MQATGSAGALLSQGRLFNQEWAATAVGSASVGSTHVSATSGLVLCLSSIGGRNPLPNARMPGVIDAPSRYPGAYVGVFGQATAYDIETQYANREPVFAYARAGLTVGLPANAWVSAEVSKDLSKRLEGQVVDAYPYLNLQAGLSF